MGFGDGVKALLETYSKCLQLLHVFGTESSASSGHSAVLPPFGQNRDRQSVLSRSLQSDRAKVQRAYSARLSESGKRLAKGDKRSRSALRSVVRRLRNALGSLVSFGSSKSSTDQQPLLNYESLRALSKASRIDAIDTIDALSARLGSSRSRSTRTASSRGSTGASSASTAVVLHPKHHGGEHHRHSSTSSSGSSGGGGRSHAAKSRNQRPKKLQTDKSHRDKRDTPPGVQQPSHKHKQSASSSDSYRTDSGAARIMPSRELDKFIDRRVSLASSSSASTRLGEIPERKLRRRYDTHTPMEDRQGTFEYNVRPTYPVRPFHVPEEREERSKKGLWGIFRKT